MPPGVVLLCSGFAVGAFGLAALGAARGGMRRDARFATVLTALSASAWVLTESQASWIALGRPFALFLLAFPVAGLFWAFVVCVFEDRALRPVEFAPAVGFELLGLAGAVTAPGVADAVLTVFNLAAAAFSLHAVFLILRSWRGDLVESRRSSRPVVAGVLALAAVFAAAQGLGGAVHVLEPGGALAGFAAGGSLGALIVAGLALAMGALLTQANTGLFAAPGRGAAADPRLEAMERVLLAKLDGVMSAGGWMREGLSIGALARELGTGEHRLRRLINARLGHRNFADFVNGYRIAAAKARLGDPAQAEVTIASIAFDLGYGSLSPFNRAFRASTGSSPTAWRRAALGAALGATLAAGAE